MGSMAEIEREVGALRRDVAELRAASQGSAGRSAPVGDEGSRPGSSGGAAEDHTKMVDRRGLLRMAGGAALGGAATGVLMSASPAAANDFDAIYIGYDNVGTSSTRLRDAGTTTKNEHILYATDSATIPASGYPAVLGGLATNSTVKHGVYGATRTPNGHGVVGQVLASTAGTGSAMRAVGGLANDGLTADGVVAVDAVGYEVGVKAGGGVGVLAAGNRANVSLTPGGTAAANRTNGVLGDLVCDGAGELWFCIGAGKWLRLAGASTAGSLNILPTTLRIYDSRAGFQPTNVQKGKLAAATPRTIIANSSPSVPGGVVAALVNVTVTNTGPAGFVSVYRNGIPWPGTSTLNWNGPGLSVANMAVVALDANSRFAAYANVATDLVIDLIGYYR